MAPHNSVHGLDVIIFKLNLHCCIVYGHTDKKSSQCAPVCLCTSVHRCV